MERAGAGVATSYTQIAILNSTDSVAIGGTVPVGGSGSGNFSMYGSVTLQASIALKTGAKKIIRLSVVNSSAEVTATLTSQYWEVKERPAKVGE